MARSGGAAWRWVLAAAALAAPAGAEEPRGEIEVRFHEIGGLTRGSLPFQVERGPFGPSADQVNDEERPLFGYEGPERVLPWGSADEIVERLKTDVSPEAWSQEGVSIQALGTGRLLVRAPATLHAAIERKLEAFEREAFPTVVLDVVALPSDAAPRWASGATDVPALACARATGFPGQRVTAFSGGHRAFLADYDVEVAADARVPDPIVLVQPDGLAVQATALLVGEEVHVDLTAWRAVVRSVDPKTTNDVTVEATDVNAAVASAPLLRLRPGAWAVVPGSAEVSFAVRASVERLPARVASPPLPVVPEGSAALVSRTYPAAALLETRRNDRAPDLRLWPSNFTPPEPPELPEPECLVPAEAIRLLVAREGNRGDDGRVEVRNGRVDVRLPADALPAVQALVAQLVERYVRSRRLDATVVSLPRAAYAEVASLPPGAGGSVLEALSARPGARVLERVSVQVVGDQRRAVFAGVEHAYLADYEVELAEKAVIANPIVQKALEGFALDADVATAAGGAALACEVRCDRAAWRSKRSMATPHGDLELPDVAFQRVRGSFAAAPGTSRVLSLSMEGDALLAVVVEVAAE